MGSRSRTAMLAVAAMIALVAPGHAVPICGASGIYVFDAPGCLYCMKVKALLSRNGIGFTSIDTTSNNRARAFMVERFNTTAVPVTVIDSSFVIGFNEARIRQLLCLN